MDADLKGVFIMTFEENNKELSDEDIEKVVGGMETESDRDPCASCVKYYPSTQLRRGLCLNCLADEK